MSSRYPLAVFQLLPLKVVKVGRFLCRGIRGTNFLTIHGSASAACCLSFFSSSPFFLYLMVRPALLPGPSS